MHTCIISHSMLIVDNNKYTQECDHCSYSQRPVSAGQEHSSIVDGMSDGCRGDEATPTTKWCLRPAVYDRGGEIEGEGEGVSDDLSQYSEQWQSTSTVDTTREREGERGGEGEGEGEREGEGEGEGEEKGDAVDGATGQSAIAKLVCSHTHTHTHTHIHTHTHTSHLHTHTHSQL